ncbi:hypothetical protein ODZ84_09745 [Chryseobacterium fluminis]|uniref:hypothetical protein n=1 Tax=Chryseobacterium fluminis TaxID=2983606 RepID=UPI0022564781|nr:hypothetical protein [Chryseobacterium sp. MMS21-Ot14]UZT99820.1 hypothetical protein ODZ84_09745 [Chryseobacterium sp. MMS21-Ot14]
MILYVCRSGTATKDDESLEMKISAAHPNLTVVAFHGYVSYDESVKGIQNVNKRLNSGDGMGVIVFYRNGKFLTGEAYKTFRQRFKNFQ